MTIQIVDCYGGTQTLKLFNTSPLFRTKESSKTARCTAEAFSIHCRFQRPVKFSYLSFPSKCFQQRCFFCLDEYNRFRSTEQFSQYSRRNCLSWHLKFFARYIIGGCEIEFYCRCHRDNRVYPFVNNFIFWTDNFVESREGLRIIEESTLYRTLYKHRSFTSKTRTIDIPVTIVSHLLLETNYFYFNSSQKFVLIFTKLFIFIFKGWNIKS